MFTSLISDRWEQTKTCPILYHESKIFKEKIQFYSLPSRSAELPRNVIVDGGGMGASKLAMSIPGICVENTVVG